MRLIWSGLLAVGLLLVALEAYEARQVADTAVTTDGIPTLYEDGTPLPTPPPPPPLR